MRFFLALTLATTALFAQGRPTTDEIRAALETPRRGMVGAAPMLFGHFNVGKGLGEVRGWKLTYKQGKMERLAGYYWEHSQVVARQGKDCVRYRFTDSLGNAVPTTTQRIPQTFTFDQPEACR